MILGLDVDGGFIYASDTGNLRLQKLDTAGTHLLVFDPPPSVGGSNLGLEGLDVRDANVIVTDTEGKRVLVYDTAGTFLNRLDAGSCGLFGGPDCTPGAGTVNRPYDVAIDSHGNIYVSEFVLHLQRDSGALPLDLGANRVQKFSKKGRVIFQLGTPGSNIFFGTNIGSPVGTGDGEFDSPLGIAVDSYDDLYVVDSNNSRVQKFNSRGIFLTKWGSFGSGNGQFDVPVGIAIDNADNVYVADHEGNRIQKFDSFGMFITSWTTTPLSQAIEMSLDGIGNYWGRNCGKGPNGAQLFQPGVDSNAIDVVDSFPFKHPVAETPVTQGLNPEPCP